MIEKKQSPCNLTLKKEIMEELNERRGENSAEELLTMLLGDGCEEGAHWKFRLFKYDESNRSFINRLNMVWVYPLYIVTIPFQWLILGRSGVDRNSLLGRALNYLLKIY